MVVKMQVQGVENLGLPKRIKDLFLGHGIII